MTNYYHEEKYYKTKIYYTRYKKKIESLGKILFHNVGDKPL